MIGIYHQDDLDGQCSAAIMKKAYPDIQLIGMSYGGAFPWDRVVNEEVIMCDFSLQPFDQMIRLVETCAKLTWIDHHTSAISDYDAQIKTPWHGSRDTTKAACWQAWDVLMNGHEIPFGVKLLAWYDSWDLDRNELVMPFQMGMRSYDTRTIPSALWDLVLDPYSKSWIDTICESGKSILRYQAVIDAEYVASHGYDVTWQGYRCRVMNRARASSLAFQSMWNPNRYDMLVSTVWNGRKWCVSLYSVKPEVDCGQIAKGMGGGGHCDAAGFTSPTLPKELRDAQEIETM